MNRRLVAIALVAVVALSGCSALSGGAGEATPDEQVEIDDPEPGATGVNQTLRLTVNETTAGSELSEFGATYPRDRFAVGSAQHEEVFVGVDTDGDGTVEREFDETNISGINTNEYSFDVTLDTDYTLEAGDVVVVRYPAIDNPDEAGEYDVEVGLNGQQRANSTVTIG